jgi:hypothetical protein
MWTHLFYKLVCLYRGTGEVWYWGGNRYKAFSENFVERWVSSFNKTQTQPDLIFCRGGFKEYHHVLKRCPGAYKIYYGAGRRYLPLREFEDYNLILLDSPEQLIQAKKKFPSIKSTLFIKPAADNVIFEENCNKEFDVCFPASCHLLDKGCQFVFNSFPKNLSILHLGYKSKLKVPKEIESRRVLRTEIRHWYSKCKMGIVCSSNKVDSCPRVIPEMIACNLPIVVLKETHLWKDKYITNETGMATSKNTFWNRVSFVLNNLNQFCPKKYYQSHLSLDKSAEFLYSKISSSYRRLFL